MKNIQTIIKKYRIERILEENYEYNENYTVRSPEDVADVLETVFNASGQVQEQFYLLSLDTKNNIVGAYIVHQGTLNSSIVHPRDVFQRALLDSAGSIIVGHNHPSGDPTPSQEDIQVTKRLAEVGKMIGIPLLDHIVLGDNKHVSLKERGYM